MNFHAQNIKIGYFFSKLVNCLQKSWYTVNTYHKKQTASVNLIKEGGRLLVKDIHRSISEDSVHTILKTYLHLRKACAWCVPHLLADEQKNQPLKCSWNS